MTKEQRDELRRLAEAATTEYHLWPLKASGMTYIAAANPQAVLQLLNALDVLETAMQESFDNCDVCRNEEMETRLCARCQTFAAILREDSNGL